MESIESSKCAECPFFKIFDKPCFTGKDKDKGPKFCPTKNLSRKIEKTVKEYERNEIYEFARMASIQEGECYINRHIQPYVIHPVKNRVQEICEFAKKMGYRKLGIAFCIGVSAEAQAFSRILEAQGFEVVSVCCKLGAIPKETIGIKEEEKVMVGKFESMCNPIVQATILNEEKTDFNILLGLCVGHDSLFIKYSQAMVTVLFVKDRVLGHNPVAALNTLGTYYARMLRPGFGNPNNIKNSRELS